MDGVTGKIQSLDYLLEDELTRDRGRGQTVQQGYSIPFLEDQGSEVVPASFHPIATELAGNEAPEERREG